MTLRPPPSPALRAPVPGLKESYMKVHNPGKSPERVEIIIPIGDELDVSKEVADQLITSSRFAMGAAPKHLAKLAASEELTEDDTETDASLVCDVCGFEAKSTGGLTVHKRSHSED